MFDNNYAYKQFGYQAITTAASVMHERLYLDVTVPDNGYMYIYVANESDVSTSTSVYFDDLSIVHQRTSKALQVLQTTDYYPFGLAVNPTAYQKHTAIDNDYLFNGKEYQDDHDLGWTDYGARMYMADIGRWGVIDPLAEISRRWNPYAYANDNPIRYIDPDGMYTAEVDASKKKGEEQWQQITTGMRSDEEEDGARRDKEGNKVYASDIKDSYKVNAKPHFATERYNAKGDERTFIDSYDVTLESQNDGGDPPRTFWSAFKHVMDFVTGIGDQINTYGPDSPESKAMNSSPGIDEAIANYYATGQRTYVYHFSPIWKDGKLTNTEGVADRHKQANNPITLTTGGYTVFLTEQANGGFNLMVMNKMTINSLFGHVGDYFGNADIVNYIRRPLLGPQPLSTTYQFYLIKRPAK